VQGDRRRGKTRSRILYWFRTPPAVKVGRSALDEDAIRMLEELNPDVEFDWTRILKGEAESRPEVDRRSQRRPDGQRRGAPPQSSGPPRPQRRSTDQTSPERLPVNAVQTTPVEEAAAAPEAWEPLEPARASAEVPEEVAGQDDELDEVGAPLPELAPPTAAHGRLGSEAVLRLRGRYAELLARLRERVSDPARLEELKTQAERLNPDTWVTDAEVAAGLEQYEEVFESLRAVVGRRRRRRRRGPRADAAE
jgi:hypothetical protein